MIVLKWHYYYALHSHEWSYVHQPEYSWRVMLMSCREMLADCQDKLWVIITNMVYTGKYGYKYRVEVNLIRDFANAPGRRVGKSSFLFFNKNSPGEGSWVHIQAIFLNQRKAFPFLIICSTYSCYETGSPSTAYSAWIWRWLYLYLDGDSKARGDRLPTSQVVVFLHLARILLLIMTS